MATYRYLACDLRTNTVLAELPLRAVEFDIKLNAPGSFKGELPLADPGVLALDPINSTSPAKTALYVDRAGSLVWGGILWTREYDSQQEVLKLGASDFLSYFKYRHVVDTKVYTNADPLFVVRDLVNYAQAKTGGNIGITVGTESSPNLTTVTYNWYDRKALDQAINDLATQTAGFDYAVDVAYDGSMNPAKYLRLGYPRRGRAAAQSGLIFEVGSNLLTYRWPEDGTRAAVTIYAAGAGTGLTGLVSSTSTPSMLDAGYPLLESETHYRDVIVQATLDAHAVADAKAYSAPVALPVAVVSAKDDPVLGQYITGDEARIRTVDARFNSGRDSTGKWKGPGIDQPYRVAQIKVKPGDSNAEQVELTLTGVLP